MLMRIYLRMCWQWFSLMLSHMIFSIYSTSVLDGIRDLMQYIYHCPYIIAPLCMSSLTVYTVMRPLVKLISLYELVWLFLCSYSWTEYQEKMDSGHHPFMPSTNQPINPPQDSSTAMSAIYLWTMVNLYPLLKCTVADWSKIPNQPLWVCWFMSRARNWNLSIERLGSWWQSLMASKPHWWRYCQFWPLHMCSSIIPYYMADNNVWCRRF